MRRTTQIIPILFALALLAVPCAAFADDLDPPAGPAPAIDPTAPPPAPEIVVEPSEAPPTGDLPPLSDGPAALVEPPVAEVDLTRVPHGRMPLFSGPPLPRAIGQSQSQARQAMSAYRVRIERGLAAAQLAGMVIHQDPSPGEPLSIGEVVTLVVGVTNSPTPEHRGVPDLGGREAGLAVGLLEERTLRATLRSAPSTDAQKGLVIGHHPLAGSLVAPAGEVVLIIGRGGIVPPPPAAVVVAERTPPPTPAGDPVVPLVPPAGPVVPVAPVEESPVVEPTPGESMPEPPPMPPPMPSPPTATAPVAEPRPSVAPIPLRAPRSIEPSRVYLVLPADSQSFPRAYGATFQWRAIAGATAYQWELQVQARDETWSTVTTETVEGTRYRPKRLMRGRFRWRVRAIREEASGEWSAFSRLYMY